MIRNFTNFEKIIEQSLYFSILLIFLDSYEIFNTPLTWIGSGVLVIICFAIFLKENIKLHPIFFIVLTLALLPTLINYFYLDIVDIDIFYTLLRVFSFLSFSFVLYVITKSSYQNLLLKIMKNIFVFLIFVSLYTYLAQLFNFYEPLRNRPGTGILGYDVQSNFWISGSHRLVGTFREPVFLVSLLFPLFLVIHFRSINTKIFYISSAILFGLTKSDLAVVFIVSLLIIEIILKRFNFNILLFLLTFFVCFSLPIRECNISPSNQECPQVISENTNSENENVGNNVVESKLIDDSNPIVQINKFEFEDDERSDILLFSSEFLSDNTGFGFHKTNKVYTSYLAQKVTHEMYLVNRTLPAYLNVKYLSRSFGTGRYFLTYEDINIQNNLLFNLFSIGMIYFILLMLTIFYFFINNFEKGLKILLTIVCISLASVEDLLPIFSLYLGLMFTMVPNEN